MPNNTRGVMKKKIDQVIGNIDTAQGYIAEAGLEFKDRNCGRFEQLCSILNALDSIKKAILTFKDGF